MKKLSLFLFFIFAGCFSAHAATCPISAGASTATAQSIISACGSGNNVTIAAGTYTWGSSQITIPCGVNVTGDQTDTPSYTSWETLTYHSQKTIIHTSNNNNYIFQINSGCSTAMTVQHLQIVGSGFLEVFSSNSNLTVVYNSMLSVPCVNTNSSPTSCFQQPSTEIWVNGSGASTTLTNFVANWNQFGDANSCISPVNVMNETTTDQGGNCSGIQTSAFLNGITITNNSFYHLEEGFHFLCYGDTCNGTSGVTPPIPTIQNINIANNDIQNIHRINVEIQPQGASNLVIQNNSVWNPYLVQQYSMGLSMACCDGNAPYGLLPGDVQCYPGGPSCSSTTPATPNVPLIQNNVLLQNVAAVSPAGYGWGYTIEWWGWGTQVTHNLLQGYSVNGGATYGAGSSPWAANYNTACGPNMGGVVGSEGFTHMVAPTQTGNATFSNSCSQTTTTAPSISPSAGSQTYPLTVTLTDAGVTGTTPVPQGNVSIWYTTDGSAPAPNSGTSQTCTTVGSTSCSFTLGAPATIKAIGMWGQGANTISYPSGYGFGPSSIVSATYTSSGPTAATPTFSPSAGTYTSAQTVTISTTTSGATLYYTTNGTTPTTSSPVYTAPITVGTTTTVQAIATLSGYSNSAVGSALYTINLPPTVSGGYLGNTGSINTLQVGATAIQFTAYVNYSDGSPTQALPDSYGNTAVWSSSNSSILTVGSTGLVSCAAVGGANVQVNVNTSGGLRINVWGMTCTAPTLTTIALSATGGITTIAVGATNQIISLCTYNVGPTDNCSGDSLAYLSSTPSHATVGASSGLVTGVAAGSAGMSASASGVTSNTLTYNVSASITLVSIAIAATGGVNTIQVGQSLMYTATCTYSDTTTTNCGQTADTHGNLAVFSSSNSDATVINPGILKGVSPGSTNISASVSGITSPNSALTVIPASPSTFSLFGASITINGSSITIKYQ